MATSITTTKNTIMMMTIAIKTTIAIITIT